MFALFVSIVLLNTIDPQISTALSPEIAHSVVKLQSLNCSRWTDYGCAYSRTYTDMCLYNVSACQRLSNLPTNRSKGHQTHFP